KQGQKVADIGCGFGRNTNFLGSRGVDVVGINISSHELDIAKAKAKVENLNTSFVEGSATQLPLADSSCDVAIDTGCSHMLSAEDQVSAEREQARVVKPGGYLLYFGFSKEHPSAANNIDSPMYRSLEDIAKMYGADFEIVRSENIQWEPLPDEKANFSIHKGINVVMRRRPQLQA
ncbi:MAG: class I SAM-dependent methyltransferase, partial [Candidatus Roizmanbacteria bacterium]